MRRLHSLALPALAAFALTACGDEVEEAEPEAVEQPSEVASEPDEGEGVGEDEVELEISYEATPMEERVATIGLLNKRNNVTQDFEMTPGTSVEAGPVILRLEACERTAPYEFPQDTGAFVQVDIRDRGQDQHRRVFSGWLFKENPSLNIVEHPIYDVWVKDCAMSFPGDE